MRWLAALIALGLAAGACGSDPDPRSTAAFEPVTHPSTLPNDVALLRDSDVPDLPFDDNPDPNQCGIPTQWGEGGRAWLTGVWEGTLIQPDVLLYDSHQRLHITGQGGHGAAVEIVLYQQNPVLDFYMVEVIGVTGDEGWVPAPFISFEPVV